MQITQPGVDRDAHRGLYATEDISEGEPVLTMAWHLMITTEKVSFIHICCLYRSFDSLDIVGQQRIGANFQKRGHPVGRACGNCHLFNLSQALQSREEFLGYMDEYQSIHFL